MKVLQSITYYHPYVSGITIYAERLGKALAKRGHRVTTLTSRYDENLKRDESEGKVAIKRVPILFNVGKGPIMPGWPITAWKEMSDVDIVLVHLPQFEGFITAFLAKLRGKVLIAVYHCEVTLQQGVFQRVLESFLNSSQNLTCRLANRIVVYTRDYAKHSKIVSKYKEKTVPIYPPVELAKRGKPLPIEKSDAEVWIGFSGRISAEKGIEYLLGAFERVKSEFVNPKLLLAGGEGVGESVYVERIKALIDRQAEDIVMLGELSQEVLRSFYESIDVLVLPSVNSTEAFGLVQVEAMLCETPVVATDLPGVRVPVGETGMGKIVPPRDSKALADAILKVVYNKKLYAKPKKKILGLFDINKTMAKYTSLFNSLRI